MEKTEVVNEKILVLKIGEKNSREKNNDETTKKLKEMYKKVHDFTFKCG